MRFSATRYALRRRSASSTDSVTDPNNFFQSIPLFAPAIVSALICSMGHHVMKFKRRRGSWRVGNLWESNAFGYFGHTGCDRPARPSPSTSRVPVTPFYTYPDHTPSTTVVLMKLHAVCRAHIWQSLAASGSHDDQARMRSTRGCVASTRRQKRRRISPTLHGTVGRVEP